MMRVIKIVLVMLVSCYAANLYAACREEIPGNVGCEKGDRATIPKETGRYRQCMNVRVIAEEGNPLSAKHHACGGGAWVYLSDHEYVCEVASKYGCVTN